MTNPYRGEIPITLANVTGALRPSFEAIAQIEAATAEPIRNLAKCYGDEGLTRTQLQIILQFGLRAARNSDEAIAKLETCMADEVIPTELVRAASKFLLSAMGHSKLIDAPITGPAVTGWEDLISLAHHLGIASPQFWQMTPQELALLLASMREATSPAPTPAQLDALQRRFPDHTQAAA